MYSKYISFRLIKKLFTEKKDNKLNFQSYSEPKSLKLTELSI